MGRSAAKKTPDLHFGPGGKWCGFTPASISGFSDLRPAAVVRELLQNSLDAAVDAKRKTAKVRFRLGRCKAEEIPGIERYREAFEKAVKSQSKRSQGGQLADNAQQVANAIKSSLRHLKREPCDVLSVLDNGIGLTARTMDALLSDGDSAKGQAATGSFGNGHMVTIPTSDLRYVLYGGISKKGERIGAGHTVLASHRESAGGGGFLSADGYFALDLSDGLDGGLYNYPTGTAVPALIAKQLDWIEQEWKHGTAVIIPTFNHFRDEADLGELWRAIAKAGACNFFAAIERGRLEIELEDTRVPDTRLHKLNKRTLPIVFKMFQEERRARQGDFLSGERAYQAWKTMHGQEPHVFEGEVSGKKWNAKIYFQGQVESGKSRIDLCRNGMWVVHDKGIPPLQGKFQDRQPFHVVLSLGNRSSNRLHKLVRKAEGPLHDKLSLKLLAREERHEFNQAFAEIKKWIEDRVPVIGTAEYTPDDVLNLVGGDDMDGSSGNMQLSFQGMPEAVRTRRPGRRSLSGPGERGGAGRDKSGKKGKGRSGGDGDERPARVSPRIRGFAVPVAGRKCKVSLESREDCKDAELYLRVDENDDPTCDHIWPDNYVRILRAEIDGDEVDQNRIVKHDEHPVALSLGNLEKGRHYKVSVTFDYPEQYVLDEEDCPVPAVEIKGSGK